MPSADVDESVSAVDYDVLHLEALLHIKLNSFRRKDQMHLLELISVGLIGASWLQRLLDDPEG